MALVRLVAYLVGVASMGMIAQGTVGTSLHDAVWSTPVRAVPGALRIVTETTTAEGVTVTQTGPRGTTPPRPASTTVVTVPGLTRTDTAAGQAVTTTVSGETQTVAAPASTVTNN